LFKNIITYAVLIFVFFRNESIPLLHRSKQLSEIILLSCWFLSRNNACLSFSFTLTAFSGKWFCFGHASRNLIGLNCTSHFCVVWKRS
jgi:hypothetical protein